ELNNHTFDDDLYFFYVERNLFKKEPVQIETIFN
ncbi:unnamed protein product, partial [marine sediment metagenome]